MNTSRATTALAEPVGSETVPIGTFGYFQARNRYRAYSLVLEAFKNSGLSQADLARRLGRAPEVVCRLLSGPGNWGMDTFSDLLFAIAGETPVYGKERPLRKPLRNQNGPPWLTSGAKDASSATNAQETIRPLPRAANTIGIEQSSNDAKPRAPLRVFEYEQAQID
jgi:hypothetical protein